MAEALAGDACTVAVVDDAPAFLAAAKARSVQPVALGQVTGIDLGRGKRVALTVYGMP
jgi:hypothetical protein